MSIAWRKGCSTKCLAEEWLLWSSKCSRSGVKGEWGHWAWFPDSGCGLTDKQGTVAFFGYSFLVCCVRAEKSLGESSYGVQLFSLYRIMHTVQQASISPYTVFHLEWFQRYSSEVNYKIKMKHRSCFPLLHQSKRKIKLAVLNIYSHSKSLLAFSVT